MKFESQEMPPTYGSSDWNHMHAIKAKYGMSKEDYNTLLASQDGVCAICGNTNGSKRLSVDHDHTTGAIRGLLCTPCNALLGMAKDNIDTLASAIDYILTHR